MRASGALLGAEQVVLELCRNSPKYGYESALCVPVDNGSGEPELIRAARAQGTEVLPVSFSSPFSVRSIATVRECLRTQGADVIHTHGYREDFYALGLGGNARLVATNHLWKTTTRRLRFYAGMDAYLLRTFDHVVAVSGNVRDQMLAKGISGQLVSVIPNGISPIEPDTNDSGDLIAEFPSLRNKTVLVSVSTLTPEKGHMYALEALKSLSDEGLDFHWLVAGEGRCESQLRSQADALGLSQRVTFAGHRSDVKRILRAADIFLMPSLAEGLPIAMLEAMWCGPAIVATRVGDIEFALADGQCGFLADPGDAGSLESALRQALSSAGSRKSVTDSALQRVSEKLSADAMTRSYCSLYDKLLSVKP
nr:glycosyltransferase [Wenzhouxiangella sp. XN24]